MDKKQIRKNLKLCKKNLDSYNDEFIKLKQFLKEIYEYEKDTLIRSFIYLSYIEGLSNQAVINKLPISESSFYRIKHNLINKIFDLYILENKVNKNEILNESILD